MLYFASFFFYSYLFLLTSTIWNLRLFKFSHTLCTCACGGGGSSLLLVIIILFSHLLLLIFFFAVRSCRCRALPFLSRSLSLCLLSQENKALHSLLTLLFGLSLLARINGVFFQAFLPFVYFRNSLLFYYLELCVCTTTLCVFFSPSFSLHTFLRTHVLAAVLSCVLSVEYFAVFELHRVLGPFLPRFVFPFVGLTDLY